MLDSEIVWPWPFLWLKNLDYGGVEVEGTFRDLSFFVFGQREHDGMVRLSRATPLTFTLRLVATTSRKSQAAFGPV